MVEFDEFGDNFVGLDAPPTIVSGTHWRSSDVFVPEWETVDFDDSTWDFARAPYPNLMTLPDVLIPGTNAAYMWHDPLGISDGTDGANEAFFRFTFTVDLPTDSPHLVGRVKIAVDDDYDFYVNGELVFENHDSGFTDFVALINVSSSLRRGKNVFAIHAVDGGWDNPRDQSYERVLFEANMAISEASVDPVINEIEDLVNAGILNQGQESALTPKLEGAITKLDQGDTKAGINKLKAFINQVNALMRAGVLSPAEGQPLLDAVEDIIAVRGQ